MPAGAAKICKPPVRRYTIRQAVQRLETEARTISKTLQLPNQESVARLVIAAITGRQGYEKALAALCTISDAPFRSLRPMR